MTDYTDKFAQFIQSLGYSINSDIIADDKPHRIKVDGERVSSGMYCLKVEPDCAVGWFRSFKEGAVHKFVSRVPSTMSEQDRKAWRAKMEQQRAQKDAERARLAGRAAERAKELWGRAKRATEQHAYIEAKRIEPLGCRLLNGRLVIPVQGENGIKSLQFISDNGSKRFLTGGELEGGYACIVFKDDDQSRIVVCEGWATGVSIRMATGLPVIVAFNAGNINPVVKSLRGKYPDAEIIIAADNDAFTQIRGKPHNTGLIKATDAAREFGCLLAVPSFKNDTSKPTDFNDLHRLEGVGAVTAQINAAEEVEAHVDYDYSAEMPHDMPLPPVDAYADLVAQEYSESTQKQVALYNMAGHTAPDKNWQEHLRLTDKGALKPTSLTNCAMMIENHDRYRHLFCYDEFAKEKMLVNCPPWEDPAKFEVRPVSDEDKTRLAIDLEIKMGLTPSPTTLTQALNSVILKRSRNPAREYFSGLVWDGRKRLDTWLAYYCGAEQDDATYLKLVGRRWLTAAVARVFEPGCKFDHMLILEGGQGRGKSRALRALATIHGRAYFDDTIKVTDLGTEKVVPKLQGVLIIELAEMSGFRRKDVSELKQDVVITHDRIVRKYANEPSSYARQFVFAGTINPIKGYLQDATGDRRFWPVAVGTIDVAAIEADRDQLWAEAVHLYQSGERLYVDEDEEPLFTDAQEQRRSIDPWTTLVRDTVVGQWRITDALMDDIWREVGVPKERRDSYSDDRLSRCLIACGYEYKRKQLDGERAYMWVKKERDNAPI